jgi:hypothetical protein
VDEGNSLHLIRETMPNMFVGKLKIKLESHLNLQKANEIEHEVLDYKLQYYE